MDPKNVLARVHALLHAAIDDTDPECFGWMPAHLAKDDVNRARKSDGTVVIAVDKVGQQMKVAEDSRLGDQLDTKVLPTL